MAFDATKPNRSQTMGEVIDAARGNDAALNDAQAAHASDQTAHGLAEVKTGVAAATGHMAQTDVHGLPAVRTRITALEGETSTARGTASTLNDRLSTSLTPAGALKLTSIAGKFIAPGDVPTYVSTTSFSVPGDRTKLYIAGASLRFSVPGGYVLGIVASSAYDNTKTTVTLDPAYPVLTAAITAVEMSLIAFDASVTKSVADLQDALVQLTARVAVLENA